MIRGRSHSPFHAQLKFCLHFFRLANNTFERTINRSLIYPSFGTAGGGRVRVKVTSTKPNENVRMRVPRISYVVGTAKIRKLHTIAFHYVASNLICACATTTSSRVFLCLCAAASTQYKKRRWWWWWRRRGWSAENKKISNLESAWRHQVGAVKQKIIHKRVRTNNIVKGRVKRVRLFTNHWRQRQYGQLWTRRISSRRSGGGSGRWVCVCVCENSIMRAAFLKIHFNGHRRWRACTPKRMTFAKEPQ